VLDHLRFYSSVVNEVKVDHLFDLEDLDGETGEDVGIEGGHVL
jgi:hypothetical protein